MAVTMGGRKTTVIQTTADSLEDQGAEADSQPRDGRGDACLCHAVIGWVLDSARLMQQIVISMAKQFDERFETNSNLTNE